MAWDDELARLDRIAGYDRDWDAGGSAPIDPSAVAHARTLVLAMRACGFPPPAVVPGVNGTVYLEWGRPGVHLQIECDGRSQAAAAGVVLQTVGGAPCDD